MLFLSNLIVYPVNTPLRIDMYPMDHDLLCTFICPSCS